MSDITEKLSGKGGIFAEAKREIEKLRENLRRSQDRGAGAREVHQADNEIIDSQTDEIARLHKIAEDREEQAHNLRMVLSPLVEACEKDCTSEATTDCLDEESVSACLRDGEVVQSALTFGMIRRGRAALQN